MTSHPPVCVESPPAGALHPPHPVCTPEAPVVRLKPSAARISQRDVRSKTPVCTLPAGVLRRKPPACTRNAPVSTPVSSPCAMPFHSPQSTELHEIQPPALVGGAKSSPRDGFSGVGTDDPVRSSSKLPVSSVQTNPSSFTLGASACTSATLVPVSVWPNFFPLLAGHSLRKTLSGQPPAPPNRQTCGGGVHRGHRRSLIPKNIIPGLAFPKIADAKIRLSTRTLAG